MITPEMRSILDVLRSLENEIHESGGDPVQVCDLDRLGQISALDLMATMAKNGIRFIKIEGWDDEN